MAFMNRSFGFSVESITPSQEFPRAKEIDLDRYMRDWYVISHNPPSITRTAHDSIERYRKGGDGRIDVTYLFRKNASAHRWKTLHPKGFVVPNTGNAVWAIQFLWPIKMQFVITYVSEDYRFTIVARERRDFVWIMASTPIINEDIHAQ